MDNRKFYRVLIYKREGRNGPIDPLERFIVTNCKELELNRRLEDRYAGLYIRIQPVETFEAGLYIRIQPVDTFEVGEVEPPAPLSPPEPPKILESPEGIRKTTSSTWLKKCSLNDRAHPELHLLMEKYKELRDASEEARLAVTMKAKEIEAAKPLVVEVDMREATVDPWRGKVEGIALALEGGYLEEFRGLMDKEEQV